MEGLAVLLVAVAIAWTTTPWVAAYAGRRGWLDPPGPRRVHTRHTPRLGGVAVVGSAALALTGAALWARTESLQPSWDEPFVLAVAIGGALLMLTGLLDDFRSLRARHKLLAQTIAACGAYAMGVRIDSLLIAGDLPLGGLSLPLTVLWIVGVTNALNMIDGLDGLATGIALISLSVCAMVAVSTGNNEVLAISLALIGALIGFLRHNYSPAKIFLGDCGSLPLGFALSLLSIEAGRTPTGAVPALFAVGVLAVPILDTGIAIMRRLLRGSPIFGAESRHIHHQLLARGLSHRAAAGVLWVAASGFAAAAGISAVVPPPGPGFFLVLLVLVLGGVLWTAAHGLGYHEISLALEMLFSGPVRTREELRARIRAVDMAEDTVRLAEIHGILSEQASLVGPQARRVASVDRRHHAVDAEPGVPV
jgi:UDP-GlcNAc:undecaprenyl-phosphate/decaprenyl-phosphate GlcNAc-1-phosphate transferase